MFDGDRVKCFISSGLFGGNCQSHGIVPNHAAPEQRDRCKPSVRILRSHSARTSLRIAKAYPTTESLPPSRVFGKPTGSRKAWPFSAGGTASPRPSDLRPGGAVAPFPHSA